MSGTWAPTSGSERPRIPRHLEHLQHGDWLWDNQTSYMAAEGSKDLGVAGRGGKRKNHLEAISPFATYPQKSLSITSASFNSLEERVRTIFKKGDLEATWLEGLLKNIWTWF